MFLYTLSLVIIITFVFFFTDFKDPNKLIVEIRFESQVSLVLVYDFYTIDWAAK